MSIILFSGGRGNKNLLNAILLEKTSISDQIRVVVNGLDDGASTGMIREIFQNRSHGISDFLKVALAMAPDQALVNILEYRLNKANSGSELLDVYVNVQRTYLDLADRSLTSKFALDRDQALKLKEHLLNFLEYSYNTFGTLPNISDFKLGNIVFASMIINAKFNFKEALFEFMKFCGVDFDKFNVLQSTNEVSFLVGILKNGVLLPNEAAVVLTRTSDFIENTYQIKAPLCDRDIRAICSLERREKLDYLARIESIPEVSSEVTTSIMNSRAIIYGAGTPFSSLLPSLELGGMSAAIRNRKVPKILVANLAKETANMMSAIDLIEFVLAYLQKSCSEKFHPEEYITDIILPHKLPTESETTSLIETEVGAIENTYPWIRVHRANVRSAGDPGKHDGVLLAKCLEKIIYE